MSTKVQILNSMLNGSKNSVNEDFPCDRLPFEGITRSQIQSLPKVDLHRHLSGSIRPEILVHIAQKIQAKLPQFGYDVEAIRRASIITRPGQIDYQHFMRKRIWSQFQHIFQSSLGTANAIYWAIADAAADNIIYVEFRISPYRLTSPPPMNLDAFLDSLRRGIQAAIKRFPCITTRIILSLSRRTIMENWPADQYRGNLARLIASASNFRDVVVGFDLSGNEEEYPNKLFVDFAEIVKSNGFGLSVHAGETKNPKSIWEAIQLLHADRIGHGIAARFDPDLMDFLSKSSIPLEICPSSNLLLGNVESMKEHPVGAFFRHGIRVTINTDNPVIFDGVSLTNEYSQLVDYKHVTANDIPVLIGNSIAASFISPEERALLTKKVGNGLPGASNTLEVKA